MRNPFVPTPCRIIGMQPETDIETTFTIDYSCTPRHGQFVEVSLPGIGEAPISISGFGDGFIELTIRAAGTLTRRLLACTVGDPIFIRGPYGHHFPDDLFSNAFLVIAAGGCAVAPVRTLINARLDDPETAEATRLIFGFKNPEAVLYKDEIERWKKKTSVIVTVDDEACTWNGRNGLITRHIGDIDIPDPGRTHAVIVGPTVMMKFTTIEFTKRKIARERIWVSFERRMACGIGKCGHCKIDDTYVCTDGPVLRYDRALTLLD